MEWTARVNAWRASGKTAREFCKGRGFSEGGLHSWSSRLKRCGGEPPGARPEVRLARVVGKKSEQEQGERSRGVVALERRKSDAPAAVVHVGSARIEVLPSADEATLAVVFRALFEASTPGER